MSLAPALISALYGERPIQSRSGQSLGHDLGHNCPRQMHEFANVREWGSPRPLADYLRISLLRRLKRASRIMAERCIQRSQSKARTSPRSMRGRRLEEFRKRALTKTPIYARVRTVRTTNGTIKAHTWKILSFQLGFGCGVLSSREPQVEHTSAERLFGWPRPQSFMS